MAKGRRAKTDEPDQSIAVQREKDKLDRAKVIWNDDKTHFTFHSREGIRFYGWYRKTKLLEADIETHAIDLFAKYSVDKVEVDVAVDSIPYEDDPRESLSSLNADLFSAASRWMSLKMNDRIDSFDDIVRKARQPTIHCTSIESIDRLILKLRETRETAIRCGGHRLCELKGDKNEQILLVTMKFTDQAMLLEGKIPAVGRGLVADRAVAPGGTKPERVRVTTKEAAPQASPENVAALLDLLDKTTDQAQARKIRATLRSIGHKGGRRARKGA